MIWDIFQMVVFFGGILIGPVLILLIIVGVVQQRISDRRSGIQRPTPRQQLRDQNHRGDIV